MLRDDFMCSCGEPAEPSEPNIEPPVRDVDGIPHYVGVCCVEECDAPPVLVPVKEPRP